MLLDKLSKLFQVPIKRGLKELEDSLRPLIFFLVLGDYGFDCFNFGSFTEAFHVSSESRAKVGHQLQGLLESRYVLLADGRPNLESQITAFAIVSINKFIIIIVTNVRQDDTGDVAAIVEETAVFLTQLFLHEWLAWSSHIVQVDRKTDVCCAPVIAGYDYPAPDFECMNQSWLAQEGDLGYTQHEFPRTNDPESDSFGSSDQVIEHQKETLQRGDPRK